MQVCDVCYGVPDFSGAPQIKNTNGNATALFGTGYNDSVIDLCKDCRLAFKNRNWSEVAKRQKQVTQLHVIEEAPE